MTISTEYAPNRYFGNGVNTDFPITFEYEVNTEIQVTIYDLTHVGVLQTLDADYQVIDGTVVFSTAPTEDFTVIIELVVPVTQLSDYVNSSAFPNETMEYNLDKLTRIDHMVQGQLNRALKTVEYTDVVYSDLPILSENEFYIATATPGELIKGSFAAGTGITLNITGGVVTISLT